MAKARAPRDRDLPGMEDRAIAELETLAADYADIRDRRIALNAEEGDLKSRVMAEMRRQKKELYKRNGIEIRIVRGDDDVKVKVSTADPGNGGDEEEDDDDDVDVHTPTDPAVPPPPPMFEDPRDIPPAPREDPPPDDRS
jgi:hypothetical protein